MPDVSLTIPVPILRRIAKVVLPAAAEGTFKPEHFTETMLISKEYFSQLETVSGVTFTCADGYRLHRVFKAADSLDGMLIHGDQMVVGTRWLAGLIKHHLKDNESVRFTASVEPDPKSMTETWIVKASTDSFEDEILFNITAWANLNSLIDYETVTDDAVGFNPNYFYDAVTAMRDWWDETDDPDEAMPMIVKQMHPQKVCTFTLRNSIGRLETTIMPKIVDEDEL